MNKNTGGTGHDTNQDGMPPPPSYDHSTSINSPLPAANASTTYASSTGGPPAVPEPFYQAQPLGGSMAHQQAYAPPAGAYLPPGTRYGRAAGPPPGTHANTVVYIVDDGMDRTSPRKSGLPIAMVCFILGLCTWVGYLFGMCFLRSPDPRERYWAKACAIMCVLWGLIVVFASIFGRHY